MRNLKISKKLIISYSFVLILLVISVLISLSYLFNIRSQVETFYNGPFTVQSAASVLDSNFEAMQKSIFRAMSTNDQTITQEALSDAKAAAGRIQEQLPVIKAHFLGDISIVDRLEASLAKLAPQREHVLELATQNRNEEAAAFMEANNILTIREAQIELDALIAQANVKGEELIASLEAAQAKAVVVLSVLGGISVLVSSLFGVYITKSITRPVKEIEAAAEQMAQGNLKVHVEYSSKDELGILADCIRTMSEKISYYMGEITIAMQQLASGDLNVSKREAFLGDFKPVQDSIRTLINTLNNILCQINQSSDQVASGSEQVSIGSQALSQGATEQASSVEELAASITEISRQVNDTARNAEEARGQMVKAGEEVTNCNQEMEHMIDAIGEISQKSKEIEKIIKTIEDISFQTNILALNAAVEAARAGSAGKGFAVVADEVRSLANKSAEASNHTTALIEASIQAVDKGAEIANVTAQSLMRVVESAGAVTMVVDKISDAATGQANSLTQVTKGVDQISCVVQKNSATAEESAAASEELTGQAQMLKNLAGQFKLRIENM